MVVTNLRNNRKVIVRINDRGPFSKGRIIDLSEAAAKELGMIHAGIAKVKVESLYVDAYGKNFSDRIQKRWLKHVKTLNLSNKVLKIG